MMMTRVAMVAVVGMLCGGCAEVTEFLIGPPRESYTRSTYKAPHRGPMTPEMWAEREKEVVSDLAAIKGAKVVVSPTKVVGEALASLKPGEKVTLTHTLTVKPNTCYHPVLVASPVVGPTSTFVNMGPAKQGHKLKNYRMPTAQESYRKGRARPYCADFAGELSIILVPWTRPHHGEDKLPLEFVLGVAAVEETPEQTIARQKEDRALYMRRMSPYERLFFESKVGPIGVFRGLSFGMSREEAVAVTKSSSVRNGRWSTKGGTSMSYQLERDHVSSIQAFFPRTSPRSMMERHWGKGVEMFSGNRSLVFWFDAERGMRAGLTLPSSGSSYSLRIEPYTPVETLAKDGVLQGDLGALLGMSMEDFKAKYSWRVRDLNERRKEATVSMPPLTNAEYNTPMRVKFSGGKVSSFELMYNPRLKSDGGQEVFDALEKAFGKPRVIKKGGKRVSFFKKSSPEITAWDSLGGVKIRVSAKRSKLFY